MELSLKRCCNCTWKIKGFHLIHYSNKSFTLFQTAISQQQKPQIGLQQKYWSILLILKQNKLPLHISSIKWMRSIDAAFVVTLMCLWFQPTNKVEADRLTLTYRTNVHWTLVLIRPSLDLVNYSSNRLKHHFFEHWSESNVFIFW